MIDQNKTVTPPMAGLSQQDWLVRLSQVGSEHGYFIRLGEDHYAALIEKKSQLLVTFETLQGIFALDENACPLGWSMVNSHHMSHLALISDGDTWFRDRNIYSYFDRLADDGFFDQYDSVLFYGAGPCGYAAAAYSVCAPGATVVAIQPQATLSPEIADWDDRFSEDRRRDFTSRYGYAPDMLDAASKAFILYDPVVTLDSMHAALFTRPNVTKLPMRRMGATLQTHLMELGLMQPLLELAAAGQLTRAGFARLMRARRDYPPYLRNLLAHAERAERRSLVETLCRNVTARMTAPKFARRLRELETAEG